MAIQTIWLQRAALAAGLSLAAPLAIAGDVAQTRLITVNGAKDLVLTLTDDFKAKNGSISISGPGITNATLQAKGDFHKLAANPKVSANAFKITFNFTAGMLTDRSAKASFSLAGGKIRKLFVFDAKVDGDSVVVTPGDGTLSVDPASGFYKAEADGVWIRGKSGAGDPLISIRP